MTFIFHHPVTALTRPTHRAHFLLFLIIYFYILSFPV